MKKIIINSPKYGSKEILVDDSGYDNLSQLNWTVKKGDNTFYAQKYDGIKNGKSIMTLFHRYLLDIWDKNIQIDHIDHNGLNNQRYNLRRASQAQNAKNTRSQKGSTSKYLGVSKRTTIREYGTYFYWASQINTSGNILNLGQFPFNKAGEVNAAKAYDEAAKIYFGEFANLNFKNVKSTDIFIKTYKKDFWLLKLSLETIKKNVTGYANIILLVPEKDKDCFDTRNLPERTYIFYVNEPENVPGWIYQQVCKLNAYKYSFSDYIMFSDSDCFFISPIDIQSCVHEDKPEILYTSWMDVGEAIVWKEPTSKFLKQEAEWEMMRRNNQVYHRSTLIALANFEPQMEDIVSKSFRFSEFNVISSFAYQNEKDKYTFINTANWTYVPPVAEQIWSHASKGQGVSEVHLREYIRTLETILKAFGLPVPQ